MERHLGLHPLLSKIVLLIATTWHDQISMIKIFLFVPALTTKNQVQVCAYPDKEEAGWALGPMPLVSYYA